MGKDCNTPCNTLHHTAPYCETLRHATTRCNTHIHAQVCIYRSIYLYIYVYTCICTYIYISFRYTEEKEGGAQRGVRETLTIEAMRHLMTLHKLQEEEEAGSGKTESDGVEPPHYETMQHFRRHGKQDERGTQAGVTRGPPNDMIHYLVRHNKKVREADV